MNTRPADVLGSVHSFDVSIGVDGPGTRFVAFLAGCPLRCLYCHSPDTWYRRSGQEMTADALMTQIAKYRRFLQMAGGGVTISGGEPLQQPAFTAEILNRCHAAGLHTALDTGGYLGDKACDAMLDDIDLVLLDIKSFDPATYRRTTRTADVEPTLRFARRLAERAMPMWIRFVLVPQLTDGEANIAGLAGFLRSLRSVERVEVLPFHRLGVPKYQALGIPFPLAATEPPAEAALEQVRRQFQAAGLTVC